MENLLNHTGLEEMISGEEIDITIDEEFGAGQAAPKTNKEIS